MRLGILKTGAPPPHLGHHGDYPAMFRALLGEDAFIYVVFDVEAGQFPEAVTACDGYIVTGSPHDAYGDADWIMRLKCFLNDAKGRVPLVGICFGHQVMAEAFGGRVAKAAAGWGIGAHTYRVEKPQVWTGDAETITLPASHQDQVTVLPPDAEVVAGSTFCPNGMLAYPDGAAISMQLHPEFDSAYAAALAECRRGAGADDRAVDTAEADLRQAGDQPLAARWITDFVQGAGDR